MPPDAEDLLLKDHLYAIAKAYLMLIVYGTAGYRSSPKLLQSNRIVQSSLMVCVLLAGGALYIACANYKNYLQNILDKCKQVRYTLHRSLTAPIRTR